MPDALGVTTPSDPPADVLAVFEIPDEWSLRENRDDGAAWYVARGRYKGMLVLASSNEESDGREWLHVSASRRNGPPSWDDMKHAKEVFFGDRYAAMILPPKRYYVNLHPNVLHLWGPLTGEWPLPEFSGVKTIGGRRVRSV
jgi:hypothetical protein